MSNTLTNVNLVKYQSEVLAALNKGLTNLSVFSVAYNSEPASIGETVYVPVISAKTASTATTDYESGDSTIASVAVTIGNNYTSVSHLTAVEASKTAINAMSAMAVEDARALSGAICLDAYNTITSAYTNATSAIAASAFDVDALIDMRKTALQTMGLKADSRLNMVLDTAYYANLLKDPAVLDMSASGMDGIKTGNIVRVAGVNVFEDHLVTSSTGVAALEGFLCTPSAMGVTVRPPRILSTEAYDVVENITDPETGVGYQFRSWTAPKSNTAWMCVECLAGFARVRTGGLLRLQSA